MVGPDRVPVVDALDVVPHPVAVDDVAAGLLGDLEHPPVDVRGHAGDDRLRRACRAAPASSCARGRCRGRSRPRRRSRPSPATRTRRSRRVRTRAPRSSASHGSSTVPRTPTAAPSSTISSSTRWRNANSTRPRRSPSSTGSAKMRTSSGPVPHVRWKRGTELPCPWRAPVPALGPADDRRHAQPEVEQVPPLLARREPDVGLGPLPGPEVLPLAIEPRRPHPVLQRELVRVLDPHPPLLGAVDEEQPRERPERLAAEVVAVLLLDDQRLAGRP